MKITVAFLVFALAAAAIAAPKAENEKYPVFDLDVSEIPESVEGRNILINTLIKQAIEYMRRVIKNGSWLFGIAPLDPLKLEHLELHLPLGLFNLHLLLDDVFAAGLGDFVVRKSNLNLRELSFELDMVIPELNMRAGHYDFNGDLVSAIPLFGKGDARFVVKDFALQCKIYLKQSDDKKSVLINRIEDISYQIPHLKSQLTGVIGGGDIDDIVNAIIDEVVVSYILRFHGAISFLGAEAAIRVANPILDQLDTWRFISPFVPKN